MSAGNDGGMHMRGATDKSKDVRNTNIIASRAIADVVRTSLGPKGMDKMVSIEITFKYSSLFFKFRSKMHQERFSLQMMELPSLR